MIAELIEFINSNEELILRKTVTQITTFINGYDVIPKKDNMNIKDVNLKTLSQILNCDPGKYWLDEYMGWFQNEETAYEYFVETVKKNACKLEGCQDWSLAGIIQIDSLYSETFANAMAAVKRFALLVMDDTRVEYLRTWICGYLTGYAAMHCQRDNKIDWDAVLLYVNRIIEEFDDICDNDISINWCTFFDRYNVRLHNYGLDLNVILQEKIERARDMEYRGCIDFYNIGVRNERKELHNTPTML